MDVLVKVSQLLLSLSILVILHELGHFIPARWFGTRVRKFYLFFDWPKKLWSKKIGDTEYGIGMLPLGGYVNIAGMVDESGSDEADDTPPEQQFRNKKAWQRLIIMVGGVTVNFLLGILIFGFMKWHWGEAYFPNSDLKFGMQADSILLREGFQNGDVLLQVGDRKFDRLDPVGFVKYVSLDYQGNDTLRATVLRNGHHESFPLSKDIGQKVTSQASSKKMLMLPRTPFEVDEVQNGSPAAKAGLQHGDRIIGVNGRHTGFYNDFAQEANQLKGQPVALQITRGADTMTVNLTLESNGTIGVKRNFEKYFTPHREKVSLAQALPAGWNDALDFLDTQMKAFGQMFRGKIKVQDNLGSLISIGNLFPSSWDWESFWHLTASLSLILAFMNLLPIPALDGGYVIFLLWEVVTGRRVSDSFMEKAVTFGFFLLLGLMAFAFGLDIWRNFIR